MVTERQMFHRLREGMGSAAPMALTLTGLEQMPVSTVPKE